MITVLIKTESHYTINRERVRQLISQYLKEKGVKGKVEVSLSIVGDRLMKKLNLKYRGIDESTVILTFPWLDEGQSPPFILPPDDILRLGEVVISYPKLRDLAAEEKKLVDDKIDELVIHGMRQLLGNNTE